jgi:hypothetical protein
MLAHKVTTFLSEISSFFKENDSERAMFTIMNVIKGVRMNEQTLFGRKSKCNTMYSLLHVFQLLLVCPCFMIRNPFNVMGSPLGSKLGCGKDVIYEFLNDARTDWRKLMYHITSQLWTKIRVRTDHKMDDTCLMIDDTDFPKTGKHIEKIGRVHSHLEHKSILGFKALFLGITDGVSQMLLDFAILGEKGKNGNYGMSAKELSGRHSVVRDADTPLETRINEYSMSKIDLTIEMIRRAISHKVRFRYVLADSWFTCSKIIKFIRGRHIKCDYIGMIKIGENGKTKYCFEGKDMNAPAIIKALDKRGEKKYSRKLKCWYMSADVLFADTKVRLFFVRRSKHGSWSGMLCTDLKLGFFEAYKIYSRRWSLEVIFKEGKGLLGLGKCQSNNFAAQIASTTLVALQYNILSIVKRFEAYETIGELFRQANQDSLEITITERIWGAILELVTAFTSIFDLTDEDVLQAVINKSSKLAHIYELYRCKMVS